MYVHQVRVIFGDTDQMGVVYYANYLRFFEGARAALLRHLGHNQRDLERWGVALPVVEASCHYRMPAHYEDLLDVHIYIDEVRGASMRFVYEVKRGGDILADGFTRHCCINAKGRPSRMPPELRALISSGSRA